jgi:uncharacterized protein (DUF1684 family)
MNKSILLIGLLTLLASSCSTGEADDVNRQVDYLAEVEAWHADRLERLRAADGYLNLAGLFWLDEGVSTFGSAADNDIVFPAAAAAHLGHFTLGESGVVMSVTSDADVRMNGEPVREALVRDDTQDEADTVTYGEFAWNIVLRAGKFGVRLRDFEHPAIAGLPPIPRYEVNPKWRVVGELLPFNEPKTMNVGTVIEGLGYNPVSPGVIRFELEGEQHQLDAYISGERYFFVFGDQTNRDATYPAGRFFYSERIDAEGRTVLDFNKSYNPPCAFGDFSTCPVASPRNRLSVRVEAGEKYVPELHVGSLTRH